MKVFAQSLRLCLIPCEFLMLSEVWLLMENFPTSYHIYKVSPWCEQVDQNKPPQIMPLWPKGDFEVKATEKQ